MSLYVKQDNTRSRLQEKLAKELQDRQKEKSLQTELPDGVSDSAYLKDTKSTTSLAWVWILLAVATIAVAVWLIVSTI